MSDAPASDGERVKEIVAHLAKARKTISALCHGGRWIMSVPARLNEDPDLILSRALDDLAALLADRAELVADLTTTRGERDSALLKAHGLVKRNEELEAQLKAQIRANVAMVRDVAELHRIKGV